MENILRSLIEGPLPNILVISGVLFLFLSVVGKIGAKIAVDPRRQGYAGFLGIILLLAGLSLYLMALVIPTVQTPDHPPKTNTGTKLIKDLKNQISEIEIQIDNLEEELASSPQPPGPLHELQDLRREREKRLEKIENLQTALRTEDEQLRLRATEDPDDKRRIEQIEGETIPDLEVEKRAVQTQLQELLDMIRNAEKRVRINELKEKKQSLQEKIDRLTKQI